MLQNFLFGLVANPPTLPSTLLRMPTNYFADIRSAVVDKLAMAAGNEIRFLATGDDVEFTFDMRETNGSIEVYYGWFYHKNLKNLASLSTDLIHPNDAGAIEIGRELAELMSPFIKQIDY